MKFIVKLPAEITIKSRPVRKRFTKILYTNIKNVLCRIDAGITTSMNWDNIDVNASDNSLENRQRLISALKPPVEDCIYIPGERVQMFEGSCIHA